MYFLHPPTAPSLAHIPPHRTSYFFAYLERDQVCPIALRTTSPFTNGLMSTWSQMQMLQPTTSWARLRGRGWLMAQRMVRCRLSQAVDTATMYPGGRRFRRDS